MAVAGAGGGDLNQAATTALQMAANMVGLTATALYLWHDEKATLTASFAENEIGREQLLLIEEDLYRRLRQEKGLVSAYMTFEGVQPMQSFTHPLRHGKQVFGAVVGLQLGRNSLIAEDIFLETLSATLALTFFAWQPRTGGESPQSAEKERMQAILETAVAVNHEVNNPLTAILGNVQLLLMRKESLDEELRKKLGTIEEAAMKIRDVTQRLMRVTSSKTTEYSGNTKMLDLSEEDR